MTGGIYQEAEDEEKENTLHGGGDGGGGGREPAVFAHLGEMLKLTSSTAENTVIRGEEEEDDGPRRRGSVFGWRGSEIYGKEEERQIN